MLEITEVDWIFNRPETNGDRNTPIAKAVRLEVERKAKAILDIGKLPEIDYADLEDLGQLLAEKGDILPFVKSGVELFGYRYEATLDGGSETRLHGSEVRNSDGYRQRGSCQTQSAEEGQEHA